ncbi:peptidase S8/S53 domain-containing protein [Mortierella sp. GBAus27b]|nr:hypothetical protein BGX31_003332 [Mortierella sp. GBA43]KAI8362915.1 peptidase S8/S53 domain-containing protein [Mortierella sp. GBAus27b]
MRSSHIILTLSLSIAASTIAAPIKSKQDVESPEFRLPAMFRDVEADSFQAFTTPLSSFLVEFDLPATGVVRHERIRLEEQGEFQGLAASRRARVEEQHKNFALYLTDDLQLEYVLRHEFFTLMNGMSIDLQGVPPNKLPKILEQIRSMPGVVNVSPLTTLNQPKVVIHDTDLDAMAAMPQLSTAHEQTGVLSARNDLNLTGSGIKIGIIDTGIDYTHEAFGSCYGPGCKIQYGYDFVDLQSLDTPGGFDCVGHGTHVAGIIAANSPSTNFYGVAPEATLGAYRVFPCTGSSKDDVIIAALEQAYEDGMDVVNLSLGGGSSWPNTPLSKAAGRLAELGVVVVAAIGNDGEQGLGEVSSPSINPAAISVASFEGSGYLANYFELLGVPDSKIDYSDPTRTGVEEKPFTLKVPDQDPEGCVPYSTSMNGTIAFIKRGTCTFIAKAKLAQDAGAIGCIFYNNADGGLNPKADDPNIHIFGHGVSQKQGQFILDQLEAINATSIQIIYRAKKGIFRNEMANQISPFSSWGLGPELELKPDIGAPGGYIYSTVPVEKGSYATMSGTSMATPYVAGSAALLLESDPTIDRNEVLGRLQMYAKPGVYRDTDVPETVARQGAGMINIFDAIRGKALVQPSHLALNDTLNTQKTYTLTLTNQYNTTESFKLSNWPAMSIMGYTLLGQPSSKIVYNNTSAELVFDTTDTINLGAGESCSVTFSFKAPPDLDPESHWIYSGYVKVEPTLDTSRPTLQVPYAGMHGSYSTVDILDTQEGFPILLGPTPDGRLTPIMNRSDQPPRTYPMIGSRIVTLVLKISNPMRNLRIYVMDAKKKRIVGLAPVDGEYIGRTDNARAKFFVVPWSGRAIDAEGNILALVDGDYSLVVVAPKPFTADYSLSGGPHESWMSPVIRIKH